MCVFLIRPSSKDAKILVVRQQCGHFTRVAGCVGRDGILVPDWDDSRGWLGTRHVWLFGSSLRHNLPRDGVRPWEFIKGPRRCCSRADIFIASLTNNRSAMAIGERKLGHFIQDLLLVAAAVSYGQKCCAQGIAVHGLTCDGCSLSSHIILHDKFSHALILRPARSRKHSRKPSLHPVGYSL